MAETSFESAAVIDSQAIYQLVEVSVPQELCREEEVEIESYGGGYQSRTPIIISTIIGGAIGNSLGHSSSNKQVGAVLGAVLGHSVGRDIMQRRTQPPLRQSEIVQRCETIYQQHEEERLIGYQVTYLYKGEEFSVRTDVDPGEQIQLMVTVEPVLN